MSSVDKSSYTEKDTVQDLYDEIEHLIDVPFSGNAKEYQPKDFHYRYHDDEEQQYEQEPQQYDEERHYKEDEQEQDQVVPDFTKTKDNDYSFDRPILIESDSDDIEEGLNTPDQMDQYSLPVCSKCNRPITSQSTLNVSQLCTDCLTRPKKGRSRSSSFTFSQIADKLKQSFGHSSSSQQLMAPNMRGNVDRRKSMPSMNDVFNHDQALAPPSPVPSRPNSRASSFIEDVKQFLAPLSRKSSRNSMNGDYQASLSPAPEGPKRKSSHSSLMDVINICKPSKPKQTPSYERRLIHQQDEYIQHNTWTQEDEEVMGIHQQQHGYDEPEKVYPSNIHIPLHTKQLKGVESRQDRMNIYNDAFLDVMQVETNLVPWIIKQTQKGPPDAWFGYTPPERKPKKIMGVFKRKSKADGNTPLRVQQQQLGDELLSRSTPLLQHRYSNSNLSVSPSFGYSLEHPQEYTTSPESAAEYEEEEDDDEEEEDVYYDEPEVLSPRTTKKSSSFSTSPSPRSNGFSPEQRPSSTIQQPVSILKKKPSTDMQRNYQQYDDYDGQVVNYDDHDEDYYQPFQEEYRPRHRQPQRRPSTDYRRGGPMLMHSPQEHPRYSSGSQHMYMMDPVPRRVSRSNSSQGYDYRSEEEEFFDYRRSAPTTRPPRQRQYEEPIKEPYCNDSIVMNKRNMRRSAPQPSYDEEEADYRLYDAHKDYDPPSRRGSKSNAEALQLQEYYGMSVKMTPYMMEEWEIALDDLQDLYPRLDRHYINDFLRSAQGDFVAAKEMIMDMIMEVN